MNAAAPTLGVVMLCHNGLRPRRAGRAVLAERGLRGGRCISDSAVPQAQVAALQADIGAHPLLRMAPATPL